ncbi:MAG TPA: pyridoxamine 5'-phosphate oxidase family protein [Firmicutes bacterium]|nr:pyridoxamine 5'-phosphate oxidase family protein [Bacillota bacterium]
MSGHAGDRLPSNVVDLLKKRLTTCVVATVTNDGRPHVAPVNLIVPRDDRTLRLALERSGHTLANIRDNQWVAISILDEGDIAIGVKGRAVIVKDHMDANDAMAMVDVAVNEVENHAHPIILVSCGVRTRRRSNLVNLFFKRLFCELEE